MKPTSQYAMELLKDGKRLDGRQTDEYREITIEYGVIATAEGSARVKIGQTEVLAGVKLGIESPFPDTPDEGALMVNVELLPIASPDFESGPPSIESIELARVVDRGIREAKAIDSKKLCIEAGSKVWNVSIDVCVINAHGNLFDACGIAALAALQDTVYPSYDGEKLDYKEKTTKKLEMAKVPVPTTIFKSGKTIFIDPTEDEEGCVDARLTVTTTKNHVCALQKGGSAPLTQQEVDEMIKLALKKSKDITKLFKK